MSKRDDFNDSANILNLPPDELMTLSAITILDALHSRYKAHRSCITRLKHFCIYHKLIYMGQLLAITEQEFLNDQGTGKGVVNVLRKFLQERNFHIGQFATRFPAYCKNQDEETLKLVKEQIRQAVESVSGVTLRIQLPDKFYKSLDITAEQFRALTDDPTLAKEVIKLIEKLAADQYPRIDGNTPEPENE